MDKIGTFYGHNFDNLFMRVASYVHDHPDFESAPRSMKVKEVLACTLVLDNPRARLLLPSTRKDVTYGFGVGEFLWYWTGKQDLETMLYYNKRMKDFSDDGKTLNSAYGFRMKSRFPISGIPDEAQWTMCKAELLRDNDSRRALILINEKDDQVIAHFKGTKDVPCTLSLQFFIRENKLHLHAHMRSNDVYWGLTYDLFSFTLMQEMMMLELRAAGMKNLELGNYYHTAGSLHIYERHFAEASQLSERVFNVYTKPEVIAPMEPVSLDEMGRLVEYEEALRTGKAKPDGSAGFTGGVRWMAEQLEHHRRKRDQERGG
jgi:thymidylate synthase